MIKPINGHLLIEPVKHESFISSDRGTYEEIGIVLALPLAHGSETTMYNGINVGDKVFFDSWMATRYPKNDDEYYWLVKSSEVRAVEPHE